MVVQGLGGKCQSLCVIMPSSARAAVHVLRGKSLRVTDVNKVRDELEALDNLTTRAASPLHTEAQHTARAPLEVPLRVLVVRVVLQPRVRHPADVLALLQPPGQGEGVLGVAGRAQAQRLGAEEQLLGGEGVEAGAEVAQGLDAGADGEGDGAEGVPELEAVVALAGLDELGETRAVLAPVELAGVDDNAANCAPHIRALPNNNTESSERNTYSLFHDRQSTLSRCGQL